MFLNALLTISFLGITAGSRLVCLYCTDAVAPADCDTVIQCGSHERCYADAYVSATGSIRYNLGCRDQRQCGPSNLGKREILMMMTNKTEAMLEDKVITVAENGEESSRRSISGFPITNGETLDVLDKRTSVFLVCSECCTGNLCSNAGCGNKGYISPRGPICYNCAQQLSENDCSRINLCGQNEVCMLQKTLTKITQEVRYTTQCASEQRCTDEILRYKQLASLLIGKRHTSSKRESLEIGGSCLVQCCKTDLCNIDCNGTSSSQTSSLVPGSSMQPSTTRYPLQNSTTAPVYKTTETTTLSVALSSTTTSYKTVRSTTVYKTPQPPTTKLSVAFPSITTSYKTPVRRTTVYKTPQPPTTKLSVAFPSTATSYKTPVRRTTVYITPQPPTTPASWVYPTPSPSKISTTNSGMCYFKHMTYRLGEHWFDGCDFKCTCTDEHTGKYICEQRCLQWSLPPSCYLYPPPPGKCCSTPVCPSNYTIQYPSGYTQE